MEQRIINYVTKYSSIKWDYVKINDNNTLEIVYNLLFENKYRLDQEFILNNLVLCYYYGILLHTHYFCDRDIHYIKLMKKCYKKAIEHDISEAMYALGYYYSDYYDYSRRHSKYKKVQHYYLMAIERGNKRSMYSLAQHYHYEIKDYQLMKK